MNLLRQSAARNSGFTLIELLVVISIVGLLASIILINLNSARDRANRAKARDEIIQIVRAADLARTLTEKPLKNVTGSGCSYCAGEAATISSLQKISAASGVPSVESIRNDPWGGKYQLDENETEGGTADCRRDVMWPSGKSSDNSVRYQFEYYTSYCKDHPSGAAGWQANL